MFWLSFTDKAIENPTHAKGNIQLHFAQEHPSRHALLYFLRGGDTRITPSPRTNRKGIVRLVVCKEITMSRAGNQVEHQKMKGVVFLFLSRLQWQWWQCKMIHSVAIVVQRHYTSCRQLEMALTFTISSYVSSSISDDVIVSSTVPRIIFKCWSYAYRREHMSWNATLMLKGNSICIPVASWISEAIRMAPSYCFKQLSVIWLVQLKLSIFIYRDGWG